MIITKKDIADYKLNILLFETYKDATKTSLLLLMIEIVFTILTLIQNNFPFKEHIPLLILGNVILILIMLWSATRGFKAKVNMLLFEYIVFNSTEAKAELTYIMEKSGLTDEQIEEILNYDKDGTSTTKDTD